MLLSSSSLVVVVAAVVVVRRHERDDVRLETTHSAHVYELRRREKMRPKNAAINLEPIPERERKRGKKIRAFCVTKERIGVLCVASTTFARTTTHRETVKVVASSSSFSSFSAGPRLVSLKFVRSLRSRWM